VSSRDRRGGQGRPRGGRRIGSPRRREASRTSGGPAQHPAHLASALRPLFLSLPLPGVLCCSLWESVLFSSSSARFCGREWGLVLEAVVA
jgi:hypothetical protein